MKELESRIEDVRGELDKKIIQVVAKVKIMNMMISSK